MILEIFHHQKEGGHIHICGWHHVAKHIERLLKICILFLIYSQIWLNFPEDDCHFLNIFQWMIAILNTNNFLGKKKWSRHTN